MSTCTPTTNTGTAARSAPCSRSVSTKAPNRSANGCTAGDALTAASLGAWPMFAEKPRQIASLLMPLRNGHEAIGARQETGATEPRSAVLQGMPEPALTSRSILALLGAAFAAGVCSGLLAGVLL